MISVIIPAHNEEGTIAVVVRDARSSPLVGEVIVVDDASSDKTGSRAREAGAYVIRLHKNVGKGAALDRGIDACRYDNLLFLDGDLKGVTDDLIYRLAAPLICGECVMVVARRQLPLRNVPPVLSGTRALKKWLWESVPDKCKSGYKVEIALNYFGRRIGKVLHIPVAGLRHVVKEIKYGPVYGLVRRISMMKDLLAAGAYFYLLPAFLRKEELKLRVS